MMWKLLFIIQDFNIVPVFVLLSFCLLLSFLMLMLLLFLLLLLLLMVVVVVVGGGGGVSEALFLVKKTPANTPQHKAHCVGVILKPYCL